jgi:hypothetical protein
MSDGLSPFALLALMSMATPAHAECPLADINSSGLTVAKISAGAPRSYFLLDPADRAGCPGDSASCRAKAFLVPGDTVLLTATKGAYACANYTGTRGTFTVGWLPVAGLTGVATGSATLSDWVGHWKSIEQSITIFRGAEGTLGVTGEATYGSLDPQRVARGGVNLGNVEGTAKPVKGVVAFTASENGTLPYDKGQETDCRLRMRVVGPYLLAEDNHNCGGHNVSFSGMYVRGN